MRYLKRRLRKNLPTHEVLTREDVFNTTIRQFHVNGCCRTVGPRGGVKTTMHFVTRNGKVQTWVTRPNEFSLPIKIGFSHYGYITQGNLTDFHIASRCPLFYAEENIAEEKETA